ncbi:MAG TPA: hypothetical protein P5315_07800 [Clostridia bacterium]|nr:hypothetical protein [Clostridia bacterium]
MNSGLKSITFSLPVEYIDKLREYSKNKIIPSMNAGIRDALDNYFKLQEKKRVYEIMKEASTDNLLLNDISESMAAFNGIDEDADGGNEDW